MCVRAHVCEGVCVCTCVCEGVCVRACVCIHTTSSLPVHLSVDI